MSGLRRDRRDRMRERDRAVMGSADVVVGIAIRCGGIMEEEGKKALRAGKAVHVLVPPSKQASCSGNVELLNSGAIALKLPGVETGGVVDGLARRIRRSQKTQPPVFFTSGAQVSRYPPAGFLWHYTRARPGPWPGQAWDQYFRSLVQNDPACGHTGFDTLARILTERKIRASGKIIRGKFEVVSFSLTPPAELLARRTFRSTLARWDFEPYAVGVRLTSAQALGVRPVSYLPSAEFDRLMNADRPFFQRSEEGSLDWRHENEWRYQGDFDLSSVSPPDFAAIVPAEDAERIRPLLTRP